MAFRNPLDSMAGMGQSQSDPYSINDHTSRPNKLTFPNFQPVHQDPLSTGLTWSFQDSNSNRYPVGRKGGTGELSPGGRKNPGMIGMQQQPQTKARKGFFGEDDDSETSMYFNQNIFRSDKEMLTSQSPSQLSALTGNFYNQSLTSAPMPQRGMSSTQFPRGNPGHVTPTSMNPNFPIGLQPIQQASPNRNLIPAIGQRSMLGQTQAGQTITGLQKRTSLPSVLGSTNNPITSISSSFGLSQSRTANENSQPSLDLSEFPTLGNRAVTSNPVPASRSYVGMVNKPVQEQTPEFQIQQEDFPALPGSQNPPASTANDSSRKTPTSSVSGTYEQAVSKDGNKFAVEKASASQQKRGIQTHHDGTVSNIPPGMVTDQFGIVGLLTFIRAAENDPNLVALAPGIDLTTLGLNMNSPENLYSTFQSPWADSPCRPQDIDFHVPCEYLTNIFIRDKLSPIKLDRYGEDLLFFLFYMNRGDVLQLAAAAELYNKDWRYHKEERVWITRPPNLEPIVKTNTYERGTYYFFDAQNWRKVAKEFYLEYDKLEEKPTLPPSFHHNPNQPIIVH